MPRTTIATNTPAPAPITPPAPVDAPAIKVSPHRVTPPCYLTPQVRAFAWMLKVSEGTSDLGDDGYNVIVGSTHDHQHLFESYADHPRVLVVLKDKHGNPIINPKTGEPLESTAAGAYQILARFFDAYRGPLGLADFSPAAQDAIMLQMLRECRAVDMLEAGKFTSAVLACSSRWASLPGNDYGQHVNDIDKLRTVFVGAGGRATS